MKNFKTCFCLVALLVVYNADAGFAELTKDGLRKRAKQVLDNLSFNKPKPYTHTVKIIKTGSEKPILNHNLHNFLYVLTKKFNYATLTESTGRVDDSAYEYTFEIDIYSQFDIEILRCVRTLILFDKFIPRVLTSKDYSPYIEFVSQIEEAFYDHKEKVRYDRREMDFKERDNCLRLISQFKEAFNNKSISVSLNDIVDEIRKKKQEKQWVEEEKLQNQMLRTIYALGLQIDNQSIGIEESIEILDAIRKKVGFIYDRLDEYERLIGSGTLTTKFDMIYVIQDEIYENFKFLGEKIKSSLLK